MISTLVATNRTKFVGVLTCFFSLIVVYYNATSSLHARITVFGVPVYDGSNNLLKYPATLPRIPKRTATEKVGRIRTLTECCTVAGEITITVCTRRP